LKGIAIVDKQQKEQKSTWLHKASQFVDKTGQNIAKKMKYETWSHFE
jgi:hypothetical protein